jgi:DNA repair protein RadC
MKPIKHTVTEITIAYRKKKPAQEQPTITSSSDALTYLLEGYDHKTIALQEQFVVMYMNKSNRILGVYRSAIGGITGTVADPRLILSVALKVAATSLILSHNHPSGSLKPSRADEDLTRKITEAARFMDIKVLDHLIVEPTGESYFSFADEGII